MRGRGTGLAALVLLAALVVMAAPATAARAGSGQAGASQAAPPAASPAPVSAAPSAYALLASIQGLETSLAAIPSRTIHASRHQRAQFEAQVAAIERNVSEALPGLAQAVEHKPEDVGLAFRFYRDADAIYQVALRAGDLVQRYGGQGEGAVLAANLSRVGQQLDQLAEFIQVRGSALSAAAAHAAAIPPRPRELNIPDANGQERRSNRRRHERRTKHSEHKSSDAGEATPHR